jgi:dihydrofolate synthase/folylpolyglutamate synthase
VVVLTGVLADKDYAHMFRPVMGLVEQFVCITPPSPRKLEATELARHLEKEGCIATPCETIAQGVKKALELAGTDGMVLCFGSLYTIADIRAGLDALQ